MIFALITSLLFVMMISCEYERMVNASEQKKMRGKFFIRRRFGIARTNVLKLDLRLFTAKTRGASQNAQPPVENN